MFKKAQKSTAHLKLAITGVSGSGKTFSALRLARGLAGKEGKVAYVDTENKSASLYSDRFSFDVCDIEPPFEFSKFVNAIKVAVDAGYDVVVIDSASHFWEGILEYKTKLDNVGGNSYTNWGKAGDKFKDILSAVLQSKIHVIACLRSKVDYVLEENDRGKKVPKKIGLAPIMRDGIEYEFTTVFDLDMQHQALASKDRTSLFGDIPYLITEETGEKLLKWLISDNVALAGSNEKSEFNQSEKPNVEVLKGKNQESNEITEDLIDQILPLIDEIVPQDKIAQTMLWVSNKRVEKLGELTKEEGFELLNWLNKKKEDLAVVPGDVPDEIKWLIPHREKAVAFLIKQKWLKEGQGLAELTPARIRSINDKKESFCKNAEIKAEVVA